MKTKIARYTWHGLNGRVLRVDSNKKNDSLVVLFYGQHANLERLTPLAEVIAESADVVMPDLPGFGGMDSFYKIGLEAGIDNLSRYIADFLEDQIATGKKVSVVCVSYSFPALTKSLSDNPKLASKLNTIVSFVGFTNKNDFHFDSKFWLNITKVVSGSARNYLGSKIWEMLVNKQTVVLTYRLMQNIHPKLKNLNKKEKSIAINTEAKIWQDCDHRTHAQSAYEMITELDLSTCRVDKTVHHLYTKNDHFFDYQLTISNMQKIYKQVVTHPLDLANHSPTFLDNKVEIRQLIPKEVLKLI